VHTKFSEHARRRREKVVSYSISPDGVHPNATGHWLMAQQLLLELHAPALVMQMRGALLARSAETARSVRRLLQSPNRRSPFQQSECCNHEW
jgi:hypothetical protein